MNTEQIDEILDRIAALEAKVDELSRAVDPNEISRQLLERLTQLEKCTPKVTLVNPHLATCDTSLIDVEGR